ncbi:MAG: hypothetical protein R2854_03065 [Caldilineaceae bacterium]
MRSLVLGKTILVRTILDKRGDDRSGKFGRLLGELLVEGDDGVLINVNQLLLDEGYAVPFSGRQRRASGRARCPAAPLPSTIPCPYCGEVRLVAPDGMVAMCPNCFDGPFLLVG